MLLSHKVNPDIKHSNSNFLFYFYHKYNIRINFTFYFFPNANLESTFFFPLSHSKKLHLAPFCFTLSFVWGEKKKKKIEIHISTRREENVESGFTFGKFFIFYFFLNRKYSLQSSKHKSLIYLAINNNFPTTSTNFHI